MSTPAPASSLPQLFSPFEFGGLSLRNRIVMAPLTRARSGKDRVPNELMVEYYTQRASAGMIIAEATTISTQGIGREFTTTRRWLAGKASPVPCGRQALR